MNQHIENLKKAYIQIKTVDYGKAEINDNSSFSYSRKELSNWHYSTNIYNCSLSVLRNAQRQPFKYICKYFNIKNNEESLEHFEQILNNFSAAEQGKQCLKNKRDLILKSISDKIPIIILKLSKSRLIKELGFAHIDFSTLYFPVYHFSYISSGGNSSMSTKTTFDIDNLNKFINYLSDVVTFRKSVQGQRALMTSALREMIKKRDSFCCQICNLSINYEPNLLL